MLKYLFLFMLLSMSGHLVSQDLHPEITNYSYGGSQNWSIDIDESQIVSIANNSGLTRFDGQSWSLHPIPKKMIVRSVLCVGSRTYIGSYEEFGYWDKQENGELIYHSLSTKFPEKTPQQSEEFWQIIEHEGIIYFRSFGSIYKYDGTSIQLVVNSLDISSLAVLDSKLLYGSLSQGVFEVVGNQVRPYSHGTSLDELTNVNNIEVFDNQLFIYDQTRGAFLYDSKERIELSNSLEQMLEEDVLNKVEFIDDDRIAFGTIKNGVIIYSIASQNIETINRKSGLRNNTVLDLTAHNGNLWLALDNGVSRIAVDSAISFYTDDTGTLGTVYDIELLNGQLYLASNTGVYTFIDNQLTLLENSEGHCWGIHKSNSELFFGHNKGALILANGKLELIEGSYSGVYDYVPIPNSQDFLLSTYSGIGYLSIDNGSYEVTKLDGLDVPIDNIIFENEKLLWATDNFKNLFKIEFNTNNKTLESVVLMESKELAKEKMVDIVKIDDLPYFVIGGSWFTYSHGKSSFQPAEKFEGKLLIGQDDSSLWFMNEDRSSIVKIDRQSGEVTTLSNQEFFSKLVDGYSKVFAIDENRSSINLKDGFAIIHNDKSGINDYESIIIKEITASDKIIERSEPNDLILSYEEARSINFKIYSPGNYDHNFTYQLEGEMSQSDKIMDGSFMLRNLKSGNYILSIVDSGNDQIRKELSIEVMAPWYLSWWMKLGYLLLLIALLFLAGRYQKIKANKAHNKAQKELLQQAKQKLEAVEKENLIKEVESRQKELINRTATIVRKNEAIITLRNELRKLQESSPNKIRTDNILKRTGEQLDSKNDWHLFESKFNSLNEDFFNNLSRKFPKLTSKDQKLCAYIKIGLTSKEIAPLLGITKRSVELQRYRLRKKLNLDTDITFPEFLSQL
ncbi:helix-turn-helix and ligand-binding sensor domain-containing protein [Nonlabens ponticola]|uniref:HTH luxR-type domain-containing protein n=1 Tax=Nonlabens ponticola TaxID=2496866 RepID=A0A3S9MUJ0_9FLAO|nr:LuxR C-terminal-related transcriptional regulator [Nonlabens ponticola]AZQ42838.1 hypothetical protein EJ995_00770 [Nonlabens ponticola]